MQARFIDSGHLLEHSQGRPLLLDTLHPHQGTLLHPEFRQGSRLFLPPLREVPSEILREPLSSSKASNVSAGLLNPQCCTYILCNKPRHTVYHNGTHQLIIIAEWDNLILFHVLPPVFAVFRLLLKF